MMDEPIWARMLRQRFHAIGLAILLAGIMLTPGCIGGEDDVDTGLGPFPAFDAVADDGESYDNDRMAGEGFIVLFSAEWCNAPCHSVMHHIHETLPDPPVLVMSTDPAEDITLEEWHEDANDFDDEGEDIGNTLTFPFMKAVEAASELNVASKPTVYFVDGNGNIQAVNKGAFDSDQEIRDMWALVS